MPPEDENSSLPSGEWRALAEDRRETITRLCDAFWQMVYPGKTDWEYPDQVLRHVKAYIHELQTIMLTASPPATKADAKKERNAP